MKKKYFTEKEKKEGHNKSNKKSREKYKFDNVEEKRKKHNEYNKMWGDKQRRLKGIPIMKVLTEEERKISKKESDRKWYKKYGEKHRRAKGIPPKQKYSTKEEIKLAQRKNGKRYYKNHKEEINKRINDKLKTNINFKLAHYLRNRLRSAIYNNQKVGSAVQDLGCSIPELKTHLESKFQEGMSWKNWKHDGWHIDHIKSLTSFDLSNKEQFLKACHYTNLQPMWAEENFIKGGK